MNFLLTSLLTPIGGAIHLATCYAKWENSAHFVKGSEIAKNAELYADMNIFMTGDRSEDKKAAERASVEFVEANIFRAGTIPESKKHNPSL